MFLFASPKKLGAPKMAVHATAWPGKASYLQNCYCGGIEIRLFRKGHLSCPCRQRRAFMSCILTPKRSRRTSKLFSAKIYQFQNGEKENSWLCLRRVAKQSFLSSPLRVELIAEKNEGAIFSEMITSSRINGRIIVQPPPFVPLGHLSVAYTPPPFFNNFLSK